MHRAVFLDRDGVINNGVLRNGVRSAPFSVSELEILPGVGAALTSLRAAGFQLIVVTNQPDVARGQAVKEHVESIHRHLLSELPLDDIRVCYHDDDDRCACRKPMPGMLYAAAVERQVRLAESFMVGDRWRDIGAGRAAGCRTIQVNAFQEATRVEPEIELADLAVAAAWILTQKT
jgi:D-glycero-D-manno-heptose 1,7-bisphosphate phosphatase